MTKTNDTFTRHSWLMHSNSDDYHHYTIAISGLFKTYVNSQNKCCHEYSTWNTRDKRMIWINKVSW